MRIFIIFHDRLHSINGYRSPLMAACEIHNINAVKAICDHAQTHAEKRALITEEDRSSNTAVMYAFKGICMKDNTATENVTTLVNEMFKGFSQEEIKEILTTKNKKGITPMMQVLKSDSISAKKPYEVICSLHNDHEDILKQTMQDEAYPEILGDIVKSHRDDYIEFILDKYSEVTG